MLVYCQQHHSHQMFLNPQNGIVMFCELKNSTPIYLVMGINFVGFFSEGHKYFGFLLQPELGKLFSHENLSIFAYSKNVKRLHRLLLGIFLCTKRRANQSCAHCLLCWHCSVAVTNDVVLSARADCVLDICWLWFGCFTHWAEEFWDHWGMSRSTRQPQGLSRGTVQCRPGLT